MPVVGDSTPPEILVIVYMLISKSPSPCRLYLLSFREIQQTLYRIFNIDVSQTPQTQHAGNRKLHLPSPAVFQDYLSREMAPPPVTCFILDSFLFSFLYFQSDTKISDLFLDFLCPFSILIIIFVQTSYHLFP